ncbi:lantibiotic immunity ABC transporter MutE/EpiE family permease subunit [Cohnella laeviribosi]|uniref:lantibiotic immunity ABC transporter MutE/EpiE family permease subunit n=1 Tax=Cohnella laeviribosi TaxID=380174 RepID=UPI003D2406DE
MLNAIRSEHLKYKRSFAQKMVFAGPCFFALYGIVIQFYIPENAVMPWDLLLGMIFNWWPLLFVPTGTALLAALSENREKKAGGYRVLRAHPIGAHRLWIGRIAVIAYYTFLSTVVLIFAALIAGIVAADGPAPFWKIVRAGLLIWLVATALIPVHLFAAARFGALATVALGLAGLFVGVLAAPEPYWLAVPWSWPLRLMCPVIGVHPNGVHLQPGDPLLSASVIPAGIAVSLLFFAATAALTAVWFAQREVR